MARASTRGRRLRSTPRPRDRHDQLAAIAADLFRRHGYHNVGVNDIAAAAGITGPAVYRHFPSKQAILGHVVLAGIDSVTAVVHAALAPPPPPPACPACRSPVSGVSVERVGHPGRPSRPCPACGSSELAIPVVPDPSASSGDRGAGAATAAARLEVLAAAVSRLVVRRRDLGALWRREGRNLPAEDRAELAARARRAIRFGVHLLRQARPALPAADAELLCWAVLSVWGSVSEHQVSLPKARFERLLTDLALTLAMAPLPDALTPAPGADGAFGVDDRNGQHERPTRRTHATDTPDTRGEGGGARREQLLVLAARMFCEHGFHAVTMEDIGAAAGISGPSIYRHYAGKADLLVAMCRRVADRLRAGARAAAGRPPADALHTLVVSFVDTVLDNRDLVAAYLMEGGNLPERDRAELRRLQRAYLGEWVAQVVAASGVDEKSARIRVHAAFALVTDLARTHRFTARPALPADLIAMATAVLVGAGQGLRGGRSAASRGGG